LILGRRKEKGGGNDIVKVMDLLEYSVLVFGLLSLEKKEDQMEKKWEAKIGRKKIMTSMISIGLVLMVASTVSGVFPKRRSLVL
jgi:hypothetical protein